MKWFEVFPGVTGADPLSDGALASWPDRAFDDRLHHLRACPVVLTELYQIARHFPLVVRDEEGDLTLMADLRSETLRRPAFDASGRFASGYRPLATRLLPFVATASGGAIRLRDTLSMPEPERPVALRQQVAQMLQAHAAGHRKLGGAVRLLIARRYLVSNETDGDGPGCDWLPAPSSPQGARQDMAMDSRKGEFLALRLLAVMEFSAMHRRNAPPRGVVAERFRDWMSRDEVLRRQTFLSTDEMIDFSHLTSS